jgi:hypothetical protein
MKQVRGSARHRRSGYSPPFISELLKHASHATRMPPFANPVNALLPDSYYLRSYEEPAQVSPWRAAAAEDRRIGIAKPVTLDDGLG